jgi:hypothetical protein
VISGLLAGFSAGMRLLVVWEGTSHTRTALRYQVVRSAHRFSAAVGHVERDVLESVVGCQRPGWEVRRKLIERSSELLIVPWNKGRGPWPDGMEWKYIEKPQEQWLGNTIRQNTGAQQNPTGSPAVDSEKPFTHEQYTPTTSRQRIEGRRRTFRRRPSFASVDLRIGRVVGFPTGDGVARMVDNRGTHSNCLEHRGVGWSVGVRTGRRNFLCLFQLLAKFLKLLTTHCGFELRPHDVLLVGDVLAAGVDEFC